MIESYEMKAKELERQKEQDTAHRASRELLIQDIFADVFRTIFILSWKNLEKEAGGVADWK